MKNSNYIEVPIKLRYFTQGLLTDETKHVIIAFHGYGQLASNFIRHFDGLGSEYFIIVPEGLHRFYVRGMAGRVGASWMTKEDRLVDIENQSEYINHLFTSLGLSSTGNYKLGVLGFSQGVATAMRWMVNNEVRANEFYNWAGSFPPDLAIEKVKKVFSKIDRKLLIIGDDDQFFKTDERTKMNDWLNQNQLIMERINYKGEHKIEGAILQELIENKELD